MSSTNGYKKPIRFQPKRPDRRTGTIAVTAFCGLFAWAFWVSLTTTLDHQQAFHCEMRWQRACEALKQ